MNTRKKQISDHLRLIWSIDFETGASLSFLGPGILEILDALPFYVMLIDKNHRILLANKATRDVLRLEPHEIVGEHCPKVVHGITEGVYDGCPLEEAVRTGEPVEREYFDEKRGAWLKRSIYPTGTWSVSGEQIYFHMTQDITRQKRTEEALRESESKPSRLYDASRGPEE